MLNRCNNQVLLAMLFNLINTFLLFDAEFGDNQANLLWLPVLAGVYPLMKNKSLGEILCSIVERSLYNWENFSKDTLTRCVEFCAGCGNLTRELGKWRACCFDILYDAGHDMLSKNGCRLYLDTVSSLGQMGLIWLGVPCSSWVPLCSSVSKRKPENGFLGDTDRAFVITGNAQMVITSIIVFIGALLGHCIMLEQPLGSVLPKVKPLSTVLTFFKMHKFVTYGGAFGGPSVKPLQLWGTHLVFKNLERERPDPHAFANTLATRSGSSGFTGNPGLLAESAEYTPMFGAEVAKCYASVLSTAGF